MVVLPPRRRRLLPGRLNIASAWSIAALATSPSRYRCPFTYAYELRKMATRRTQQATYGYAITCHKSQGSQWDRVCLFNESFAFQNNRKEWLYTAVTRAAQHLTLVI